jgi:hypothetical protein
MGTTNIYSNNHQNIVEITFIFIIDSLFSSLTIHHALPIDQKLRPFIRYNHIRIVSIEFHRKRKLKEKNILLTILRILIKNLIRRKKYAAKDVQNNYR